MALALGLASSGCSAVGGDADVDLRGTWVLASGRVAAGQLELAPDTRITLTFDDDGMGGTAPCNDYGADYELDGESFDIPGPGIEQTFAGCGDEPLESAYLSGLAEVTAVSRDGDILTMTGEEVEITLHLAAPWPRAEVVDRRWRLVTWTDDSGVDHRPVWKPGARPFVRFGDSGDNGGGRVSASTGCRRLDGRWQVWRGVPRITSAEWEGDCPDPMIAQEVAINNALSEPFLETRTRDGVSELVLRSVHATGPSELVYRR